MHDEEIQQRINAFPRWHYRFDLRGNYTPIFDQKHIHRHQQRKKYFFEPLVSLLGGSLAGKRVLDLGCNAGFWSLAAIEAGCDYVLGIDGRQMHIDQANFVFEVNEVDKGRYRFLEGNILQIDFDKLGAFDVVLCLGLLYHVSKPMELMERISAVNTDILVVDTALSRRDDSVFEIRHDALEEPRNAVDYELVMVPNQRAVHDLARQFGYSIVALKPDFRGEDGMPDYRGARDYRNGTRKAFLCAKRSDLSRLAAEVEPIWEGRRPETATGDDEKSGGVGKTHEVVGVVAEVDTEKRLVWVKPDNAERSVRIRLRPRNLRGITLDGEEARIKDIKKGRSIRVRYITVKAGQANATQKVARVVRLNANQRVNDRGDDLAR